MAVPRVFFLKDLCVCISLHSSFSILAFSIRKKIVCFAFGCGFSSQWKLNLVPNLLLNI